MTGKTTYTPEKEQEANAYVDSGYIELEHVIPSIVGMSIAIEVNKSTLYKWAEDGHGTMSHTLARCQDAQHVRLLAKGLTNDFNATIVKLALANHGYSDKQTTEISGPNGGPVSIFEFVPVGNEED